MAQTKIKAGLFEGIIGNGPDGYFLMSNGDGTMTWSAVVINPTITSIAYPGSVTAADPAGGETITVTGTGFKTGATVTIGGTAAPAVSYVSATQITFTTPAKAAGDYDIVVTNTDTGSATYINGISYNGIPTWTTAAGSLGTFASDTTISTITLQATEPDAGTITFSITNGALPTGLSLTGANIDGTTTLETADTLYTFTVTATDDESQATPRIFTITVEKAFLSIDNFTINTYVGNGSTQSIEGKINTAAQFDGSGYINLGNSPAFSSVTTGELTISFWINTTDSDGGYVLSKADDTQGKYEYDLYVQTDGTLTARAINSSAGIAASVSTTATVNNGAWHHVVFTIDDGTSVSVSVDNGTPVTSTGWSGTAIYQSAALFMLGTLHPASASAIRFSGKLDQVRVFDKVLSSSEITTLYGENNTSTTKSTTDIFNDGSGIALYEFEKGAKDTGSYAYGTGAIDSGQSAVFNGGSSYIETTNNFGLSGNVNFTLSCWIKVDSLITGRMLDMWNGTIANNNCIFFQLVNGRLAFDQYAETYISGTDINVGVWNHVAFTRQTNNVGRFYINGVEIDSHTYSSNINLISDPLIIGKASNNAAEYYFDGSIDQVRIYSSVLSASDVEALASETNVPTANLVAHYKLDGNANDETGSYNGTASNITYSDPAEFPLVAYNGTPTNVSFVGTSFQSDLVWIKKRSGAQVHNLYDSVRGVSKVIYSNLTNAEATVSSISSFDTNGITLGNGGGDTNASNETYVAWCWKAGGAAVSNTQGTITSTVSANVDAGFSIVKWTGNGSTNIETIGHGLSTPEMIIWKNIDRSQNWHVYNSYGSGAADWGYLNLTDAFGSANNPATMMNQTAPTSTVFTIYNNAGNANTANYNGEDYIAYCFHSVDGYQKIGNYTADNQTTKNITTGFRPRFLLLKRTNSAQNWVLVDDKRPTYELYANTSGAQAFEASIPTFNDNGFTLHNTRYNGGTDTYIYLAIA